MAEPLEYTGLMAASWDAFRGDTSDWEDRHFFLELVRERGEPVLDVGCGTGRLLLDFLRLGVDIDGVEVSREMLDRCAAKAAAAGLDLGGRLHEGRMENLDLERRYRTIIVPSSSFQLLFDDASVAAAMAGFHRHLVPGGSLAMPFMDLSADYVTGNVQEGTAETTLEDGSVVRRSAHGWFDSASGLESTDTTYELLRDGEVVATDRKLREPATRSYTPAQALTLYRLAGFSEIEVFRGFTREAANPGDRTVSVVGRRDA